MSVHAFYLPFSIEKLTTIGCALRKVRRSQGTGKELLDTSQSPEGASKSKSKDLKSSTGKACKHALKKESESSSCVLNTENDIDGTKPKDKPKEKPRLSGRYQRQKNFSEYEDKCALEKPHRAKDVTKAKISVDSNGKMTVNQYVLIKKLGTGSFGKVKLFLNTENNQLYAIKIMKKKTLLKRRYGMKQGSMFEDVVREISIMRNLDHKNVLKLYEIINDPKEDKLFLAMEYAEGGPVIKLSEEEAVAEPLPEAKARKFFLDTVCGLEYLHSKNIIHRDIKPGNLLLATGDVLKISDFGVSVNVEQLDDSMLKRTIGSPAFLAPELCASETQRIFGPAIDIWSLGVTLYFFIFGRCPFSGQNELQMYENIRSQELTLAHSVNKDLEDLLKKLLEKDPEKRISIKCIYQHPWITKEIA